METKLADALQPVYDVCVIGSGPAGIILALEYSCLNPGKKILLVEYGGKEPAGKNTLDSSIQLKNPLYHHKPEECTNKGLGGTSATWGGRCVMWDEVDFMDRTETNGASPWNMNLFKEINQYVQRASKYFECGEAKFNLHDLPQLNGHRIAENFIEGIVTDSAVERWSIPTRFGPRYERDIVKRPNLTLLQGFEGRDFSSPDACGKCKILCIREVKSQKLYEVRAEAFVIATGAHEATRILLRNTRLFKNLNTVPSALGKYYQGHLSGKIASVRFSGDPKKTDYGFIRNNAGVYLRRRFQFSNDFLLKQGLLNTAIWLDNPLYHDPKHRNGAMSFMYLAMLIPVLGKKLAPPAIAHSITKGQKHAVNEHIWNVLRGMPGSLLTPASIFYRRYIQKRKLPGIFLFNPQNYYALHFHAEQSASPLNKMELAVDGETLVIDYKPSEADVNSVIKLHDVLNKWLQQCGCGALEYWYTPDELPEVIRSTSRGGIHQSGTTRMGCSSNTGVVDGNLKVWGTDNIYVCSSSVFPVSGQANPTFLLGAFAIRLANRLSMSIKN